MTNLTDLSLSDTLAVTGASTLTGAVSIGGVNVNSPAVVATTADLTLTAALHA